MAHFAEINQNDIVLRVVVVNDQYEADGVNWCVEFFGGGTWVQTSYNATIRKNFAGISDTYDEGRDAFIPPQPFPSWGLDEATCRWAAPQPYPNDGLEYAWDEDVLNWVEPGLQA